ncbi:MAG: hypothetical protein ACOYN8_18750 [Pseudanabaena sp.]
MVINQINQLIQEVMRSPVTIKFLDRKNDVHPNMAIYSADTSCIWLRFIYELFAEITTNCHY